MAWEWAFRKMKPKACAGTPRLPKTATQLPSSASERSTSKAQEFRRTRQRESSGCASRRTGQCCGEFWLGAAYHSGTGVAKDTAEALRWYRKAGDHGNAAAQYNLGQAYNLGNGVEKDTAEAARRRQKAAEQGLAKAQYNLGMAYRAGVGVEKDNVQAYFWIAIAASSLKQGFVKDYRDKAEAVLTPAQLADVQERIRKWEEAHPAAQTASLNSLPSVPPDQHQAQPQAEPSVHPVALGIRPVFIAFPKPATCDGKLASVLFFSFKEASQPRSDMS